MAGGGTLYLLGLGLYALGSAAFALSDPQQERLGSRYGLAAALACKALVEGFAKTSLVQRAELQDVQGLDPAVASTLVTNPVTFGPVYYGAYQLGKRVLGEPPVTEAQAMQLLDEAQTEPPELKTFSERIKHWIRHLGTVGKPLAVGLAIVASVSGLAVYFLASGIWILKTRWTRNKRLRSRASRPPSPADERDA